MEVTNNANVTEATVTPEQNPAPEQTPAQDYEKLYKDLLAEKDKLKDSFDKAASEAAGYKRKLAEHLTKEEQEKLEREQADKDLREELETLRQEKRYSTYSAKLLESGLTADVAGTLAKTLPDGVPNEFFDGIKKFISDETARIRAEALKQQPNLTNGLPPQTPNVDDAENAKMRKWFGI